MGNKAKKLPVQNERVDYFDFLRVFSIIFVVMIHTVYQNFENISVLSWQWQTLNVYDSLSRWAVPVFVMISGALFLNSEKTIKQIFRKNILRLVTAYLFWLMIYCILCQIYYNNFNSTLIQLLKGHYHMWFIFMIIGLYIVTPILKKITEDKSLIRLFLILAGIFAFLLPDIIKLLEIFGNDFSVKTIDFITSTTTNLNINIPLGYVGYFMLGYVLHKCEISKKLEIIIYVLGIAGFAFTLAATSIRSIALNYAYTGYYNYISLNVAAMSAAVFVFFKKHYRVKSSNSKFGKTVRKLSKCSFGVYLIHLAVLEYMNIKLHFTPISFNPVISTPVICLITLLFSFALSYALNSTKTLSKYIV